MLMPSGLVAGVAPGGGVARRERLVQGGRWERLLDGGRRCRAPLLADGQRRLGAPRRRLGTLAVAVGREALSRFGRLKELGGRTRLRNRRRRQCAGGDVGGGRPERLTPPDAEMDRCRGW